MRSQIGEIMAYVSTKLQKSEEKKKQGQSNQCPTPVVKFKETGRNGKKREETGRNRKKWRKKTVRNGKKREETGRKKQEEKG